MRRTVRLAVLAAALGLAAPAIAAYVCHPDPAGTRALSLRGDVLGFKLHGTDLIVAVRSAGTCRALAWRSGDGTLTPAGVPCAAITAAPQPVAAHSVRIVRPAAAVDRPDRLVSGGDSWPLPVRVRPHTLQVSGSLAAYSALGGNGLWITRLTDGRTTFVAPTRAGTRAILDARGVAYIDNVYKHRPATRPIVKFVPTRALAQELSSVGRPVNAGGTITSFSMDGTRVALVVSGGAACDRVVFWDIPWRSVEQVSQKAGVTCAASGASKRISQVALGGARAQWVTMQDGRPIVVAADDIGCQEWVISRLSAKPGFRLAADGANLAFALAGRTRSSVGTLTGAYRSRDLYRPAGSIRAIAADGYNTAVLSSGRIDVRTRLGRSLVAFEAPNATSLAMRADTIAATTRFGRLDVYRGGLRMHSWRLPTGTAPHVDLHFGIAVVTAGNAVYAVNVATGRTARLASAPSAPRAQIETIGVVYAYGKVARLIPMSRVEAALR
jgi:hypothetical protein